MQTEKSDIYTIAKFGDIQSFKQKFKKEEINKKSEDGASMLQYAISGNNFDIALFLIKEGIDVNIVDVDRSTALHSIACTENTEVAKLMLDNGGDLKKKDKYGNNPMWTAAHNSKGRYYDMIELFLKYDYDITSKNRVAKSPVDLAIERNYTKLIELFIES